MANKEQLERLKQDVQRWSSWRAIERGNWTRIDLSGADLSDADLTGADLSDADLTGANLSSSDLTDANLIRADLSRANLSEADLSYAKFGSANLSEADLSRANFSRADLLFADPSPVKFSRANLSRANFSRANLVGANLSSVDLRRVDLSGADLTGANLSSANLSSSDLLFADLSGANLSGADLSGCNLRAVNFSYAQLDRANLHEAEMVWTILGECNLHNVRGLETIKHIGPSHLSINTIYKSGGDIPEVFVRGTGAPETFIEYMRALVAKPIDYYTCFISYASKDELFAQRLHNDLQQEGVRCWFAPEDMDIGDKIRHRIEESIRLYDKLLLILSQHSINSSWVAYEVERALNKEPQGVPNVLYPIRLDKTVLTCDTSWAQDIKSTRHIGDFEAWTDPQQYQANFQRLLRALKAKKQQGES